MRINESRMRRIIREEAMRVLGEQATGGLGGAYAASIVGAATPEQIDQLAGAYTDVLMTVPPLILLRITPGGRDLLLGGVKTWMQKNQSILQSYRAAAADAAGLARSIRAMDKQIGDIVTSMLSQGKGYSEIADAVLNAMKSTLGGGAAPQNERRNRRLREMGGDDFDDFGGGEEMGDPLEDEEMDDEDEEMTVQSVIERYKDEGPRSWMRVSNDFHEMADGGMDDIREKYYPGLTADDCAMIAAELDRHFGMD